METNLNYHHWLLAFIRTYPIPRVWQRYKHTKAAVTTICLSVSIGHRHCLMISLFDVQDGAWDDVSGETFLRKLLTMPIQEAKWNVVRASPGFMCEDMRHSCRTSSRYCANYDLKLHLQGREEMYDTVAGIGVDPRNIAQRIMDVSCEASCACAPSCWLDGTRRHDVC